MNKSKIRYLVLSDIHLGHTRTKTIYIIDNLHGFFRKNHNLLSKLNIIFIAGDLYDRLLASNSKEFILANEWLSTLAMYCSKYSIKLRILEGTPSHDWKQVSVFDKSIKTLGLDVDYQYINSLHIELNTDLGISILYVPDEWNHSADITYKEVQRLLAKYELESVDIAIMHGQFHHQLPMITLDSSHTENDYLSIVKYYINIGHIHISSVYQRILAQGSFDRLAHNEEGDKGCMVMTIYCTGDMEFMFLKNHNAQPYKKYDLSEYNTKDVVKYLNKELPKLDLGTRVKVIVNNSEISRLLMPIQDRFKDLVFTIDKKKNKTKQVIKNNRVVITPFEITKDNIVNLLSKELVSNGMCGIDVELANKELHNVV